MTTSGDSCRISVTMVDGPIDVEPMWKMLADVEAGANSVFLGTTRRTTHDKRTQFLVYEAYHPMAQRELDRIAGLAAKHWSLKHLTITHRLGRVDLGEASIAVGASAAHRKEVFQAIAWVMDEIKASVPIWKQENWEDGETQWVHP